jgi:hypothetical protein
MIVVIVCGSLFGLKRVTHVLNVHGDGNCGDRALSYLHDCHEDEYYEFKMDMLAILCILKSFAYRQENRQLGSRVRG